MGTVAIIGYYSESYTAYQYMDASLCCFLGANMLEAPIKSILSKTFPTQLSQVNLYLWLVGCGSWDDC